MTALKRIVLAALVALAATACEPDPRNDAMAFLDRVSRIDTDDPLEERQLVVESLASLPLRAEEVRSARDVCVDAHRAILSAEEHTAAVRSALEAAGGDEASLSAAQRAQIESDLTESTESIARSRPLLTRCHRMTNDLRIRYASRRARALDE